MRHPTCICWIKRLGCRLWAICAKDHRMANQLAKQLYVTSVVIPSNHHGKKQCEFSRKKFKPSINKKPTRCLSSSYKGASVGFACRVIRRHRTNLDGNTILPIDTRQQRILFLFSASLERHTSTHI